jgi:mRNA interferase YafQ
MRTIRWSNAFQRDYKKLFASARSQRSKELLQQIVSLLAADQPLTSRHRDHALSGNWNGHRECHLKPDLLLIYRRTEEDTLELVRLASHSELFG